jgi:hypothetical protein
VHDLFDWLWREFSRIALGDGMSGSCESWFGLASVVGCT